MKIQHFVAALVIFASLGFASRTDASLLASDQFNYTLNAGINGQSGGTGFFPGNNWAYSSAVSGSISNSTIVPGLSFGSLPVSGNALRLRVISSSSAGFGDTVNVKRRPATVPNGAGDEFWTRYLFKMDRHITANNFRSGFMIDDAENTALYVKFGSWGLSGAGNGAGGVNVDSTVVSVVGATTHLSDTNTYLMISKFTHVNEPSSIARVGKFWALSLANYNAIASGGITELELDANNVQFATETVMPTAQQPLNFTTSDFYDFRGTRPAISNDFENYLFDEFYAGTSLGDLGIPVPEPVSLVFEAGALMIIARRPGRKYCPGRSGGSFNLMTGRSDTYRRNTTPLRIATRFFSATIQTRSKVKLDADGRSNRSRFGIEPITAR